MNYEQFAKKAAADAARSLQVNVKMASPLPIHGLVAAACEGTYVSLDGISTEPACAIAVFGWLPGTDPADRLMIGLPVVMKAPLVDVLCEDLQRVKAEMIAIGAGE